MKMNRIVAMITLLLMLMTTFAYADGQIVGQVSDFDEYISYQDGKLLEPNVAKQSFWESLFSGQAFSFVDIETRDVESGVVSCSRKSTHGSFSHAVDQNTVSGTSCSSGQYIVFKSDGGQIPSGNYLFDQAWKKTNTDDRPAFRNYWINDYQFSYSYACYDCSGSTADDFEKGCLTDDKQSCVSKSDSQCDIWYGFEKTCMQHIGESTTTQDTQTTTTTTVVQPKIDIVSAETNKEEYEVGDTIYIKGYANVKGEVDNGVIETSLEHKDYATVQPLSITVTSNRDSGVCGNHITTGVKFDASNGQQVAFTLRLTAQRAGTYDVDIISALGCREGVNDKFTLDTFRIVETESGDTITGEGDTQEDTVTDETPSDDVTNIPDIDFSDIDFSDKNTVTPTTNTPELSFTQKYFDFANNPTMAYSLTVIIGILIVLIGAILMETGNKKR